ncbi:hypothetical protein FA15DRAFT_702502 [Coprinopsis marcescibilis]|uniref:Uncharacterized protein n=1 Tax=Coprinopsis marcescibilis TaxID=230819 RepID=A0A5C3L1S6_COPMA|nr:hypothetical protein FA15DRAFT_702502 [Coprinopsis marcescibilis]
MASMFRASPWVTYQPTPDPSQTRGQPPPNTLGGQTLVMDMAMDVDMDAPQIQTLKDEDSPPPQRPQKKAKKSWKAAAPAPRNESARKKAAASEEEFDEPQEDEEDQLIDDDEEGGARPSSSALPGPSRSAESTPKKKPGPKARKPKKEKQPADGDKKSAKDKGPQIPSGAPNNLGQTVSWFHASPYKTHPSPGQSDTPQSAAEGAPPPPPEPLMLKLAVSGKKKQTASSRKASGTAPRTKAKAPAKQRSAIPPALVEDAAMSEAGFTGTAASSPATAPASLPEPTESGSPEPDARIPPSSPTTVVTQITQTAEEIQASLEGVPIPQYPLPTRPFPVQPPVKITTGFAPPMALDRTGKKVRHWKVANREVRGIAGGRWFARTWVGDKDSDYAASVAAGVNKAEEKMLIGASGLPRMGATASVGRGRGRGGSKSASAVVSAVNSRAGSAMPDAGPSLSTVVRQPSRMRLSSVIAPDDGPSEPAMDSLMDLDPDQAPKSSAPSVAPSKP